MLLFHLAFESFSGGFVGVDIFFVISGFLITSLLVHEADRGGLSLVRFYRRRILRLLPALFTVVAFSAAVAAILLLPRDLRDFGRSMVASGLFSANILFYFEAGYFDAPAHLKPLLHSWSLAVEEQFYLFFPLLLIALRHLARGHVRTLLAALLVASLLASQWQATRDDSAAFFLPQYRVWELLVGALIALTDWSGIGQRARTPIAAIGLLLALVPVFLYSPETDFPGFAALVPVAGAAMLIVAGTGPSAVNSLLGRRAPVFVGRISYSLYLWHWPLAVFAGYYLVRELTTPEKLAILALSFAAAWASWRFVERPFRRDKLSTRTVFALAAAATAVVVGGGAAFHVTDGLAHRFRSGTSPREHKMAYNFGTCFVDPKLGMEWQAERCTFLTKLPGARQVVLWGDSHAAHYFPGLRKLQSELPFDLTQITMAGCPPVLGDTDDECGRFQRSAWARIAALRPRLLIVSRMHSGGSDPGEVRSETARVIAAARSRGIEVLVIGESPIFAAPVPQVIEMLRRRGQDPLRFKPTNNFRTDRALRSAAAAQDAAFFSPAEQLCRRALCATTVGGAPAAWDPSHLTPEASGYLAGRMKPLIARALGPATPPR